MLFGLPTPSFISIEIISKVSSNELVRVNLMAGSTSLESTDERLIAAYQLFPHDSRRVPYLPLLCLCNDAGGRVK